MLIRNIEARKGDWFGRSGGQFSLAVSQLVCRGAVETMLERDIGSG